MSIKTQGSKVIRNLAGEILTESDALIDLRSTYGVTKTVSNEVTDWGYINAPKKAKNTTGLNLPIYDEGALVFNNDEWLYVKDYAFNFHEAHKVLHFDVSYDGNAVTNANMICGKNGGAREFFITSGANITIFGYDNTNAIILNRAVANVVGDGRLIANNERFTFAFIKNNNDIAILVNGVVKVITSFVGTIRSDQGNVCPIGKLEGFSSYKYTGNIYGFKVWNDVVDISALSLEEYLPKYK